MRGFSVIIPTLQRPTFVMNTVMDLVKQEFEHPFEIIIVDQSQQVDDAMVAFAKAYPFIIYKFVTHFKGLPEARNYGASLSRYDYLLFLDDDINCELDLLQEHYKSLLSEKVGIVAGGITERFNKNIDCEIGKFVKYSASPLRGFHKEKQGIEVDHAGGGNFSIKKVVFKAVGGVDEHLTKGAALYEETDLCMRVKNAGYTIVYNYRAHMYHLAADTGGCRVADIHKYIFALARNRSIIIKRYLPWYYQLTAKLFLLKLVLAYAKGYKDASLYKSYKNGKREGLKVGAQPVLNTSS